MRVGLVTVALALICAPSAMGGTVRLDTGSYGPSSDCLGGPCSTYTYARYDAAPGEVNDVRFGANGEIRDSGAPVTPGPGCARVDDNAVTCGGRAFTRFYLGDMSDRFASDSESATAYGGTGDDVLLGGPGNDQLFGEGGVDELRGGAADDLVSDGDVTGAANADVLDGGNGFDRVGYYERTAGVTVDLRSATSYGGEQGERDSLIRLEEAAGGSGDDLLRAGRARASLFGRTGDDRLVGGASSDEIWGGAGNDRVTGAGLNDELDGGDGADRLSGGGGHDRLAGRSGRDRIRGGTGRDRLAGGAGVDRLTGAAGADRLTGGAGADRLTGGSGADRLFGGRGRDRLAGGLGTDFLFARDRARDLVNGGRQRDRARIDHRDRARLVERLF
jgi:Ca2+-binding RTX toxin-like protein